VSPGVRHKMKSFIFVFAILFSSTAICDQNESRSKTAATIRTLLSEASKKDNSPVLSLSEVEGVLGRYDEMKDESNWTNGKTYYWNLSNGRFLRADCANGNAYYIYIGYSDNRKPFELIWK